VAAEADEVRSRTLGLTDRWIQAKNGLGQAEGHDRGCDAVNVVSFDGPTACSPLASAHGTGGRGVAGMGCGPAEG
jgi:hypothetical protein